MGDISQETILVFAHFLGIDLENETELIAIAENALKSLPSGWELGVGDSGDTAGVPYFFNNATNQSDWHHPHEERLKKQVKEKQKRLKKQREEKKGGRSSM
jgi:hypothetical protein